MYSTPQYGTGQGDISLEVPQSLRHLVSPFPDTGAGHSADGPAPRPLLLTADWGDAHEGETGTMVTTDRLNGFRGLGRLGAPNLGDQASAVWKNIKPSDVLTLAALRVLAQADGWHDAQTGDLISQVDSDFRSESLMASLIHATMPGPGLAWTDNTDGHTLTNAEAFSRWTQSYGPSATIESVLRQAGQKNTDPTTPTPPLGTGGVVPFPVPTTFAPPPSSPTPPAALSPTGLPARLPTAALAPAGMTTTTLLLIGGGVLALAAVAVTLSRRKGGRA